MNSYIIWEDGYKGVDENACINQDGDFIGLKTGKFYPKEKFKKSETLKAIVKTCEDGSNTGMMHLSEESNNAIRKAFIGCELTFRRAHNFGNIAVYHCLENKDYYTQNELQILW